MADTARKPATYADLEAVPDHLVAEIIFGSLETHPRPAPPHAAAQFALSSELAGPFQKGVGGPGGWVFMTEPELRLGPHVVSPDLAGWRRDRMPAFPKTTFVEIAPDWVCEFLSPGTEQLDRGPKRQIHASYGVGHLWHIDPVARLLEVFELRNGQWLLFESFSDGDLVEAPPFAAAAFQIGLLWPLEPSPTEQA
jgi:Uma2 family endonuclease